MPIYEYECSQCHQPSDALQKVNDPPPETCPHCGARNTLSRLLSRTSFVLKGGGWYADLYSSSGSGSTATTGSGSTSGGSSSTSGSGSSGSGPVNSAPKVAAAKA
jgi:putative FmdB family regulatory protein